MGLSPVLRPARDDEDLDPATCSEMILLWYQFRDASRNALYYADLEARCDKWNKLLQIAITVLSLCATAISAAKEFRDAYGIYAALSGGLAFVLAGAIPYLGLNEAAKNYGHLARSFQWTAGQMRDVLTHMRRSGVNGELLGRSKQLCSELAHYKSSDSAGSEKAQKKYTRRINETYPPDYVWDHL